MSVLSENQLAGASGQGGGYTLTDSLRFRSSASAYLSRTPASASNRKTWTFSAWVKLGTIVNTYRCIFSANNSADYGTNGTYFWFRNDYKLQISIGSGTYSIVTNALFRDPSAWYHVVVAFDTTQGTSSNRVKMYVNGVEQTYSSSSYPTLNYQARVNDTSPHTVGSRRYTSVDSYFDGYITEINFVDGQALTASDFGETDTVTGVWQPKKYTGTYGTNGFYLKGRGTDNSGNGNNWTENNFNTTNSALTTYDIMTDVPTLTDEDTANYAVMNPLAYSPSMTFSNGNLTTNGTLANWYGSASTIFVDSGKWYWETTVTVVGTLLQVGAAEEDWLPTSSVGLQSNAYGYYSYNGNAVRGGPGVAYGATFTTGDVIGFALDYDNGAIWFSKNGTWQGGATIGEVEAGTTTNAAFTGVTERLSPASSQYGTATLNPNFGQRPFAYTPPTGFKKLNTFNLPDSSIVDGSKYFNTITWTGDGASSRSFTGVGFEPDFVWSKQRNIAQTHANTDSVRGVGKRLATDNTAIESTSTVYGQLTAFDSDGFTATKGSDPTYSYWNILNGTYVAWNWKAGGTAVSNTDGTNPSTVLVSANPTAGFSIVTYNPSSGGTVGHGLGTAPELIIDKKRDAAGDWIVQTTIIDGSSDYLRLNTTAAAATLGVAVPTATVYTPSIGSGASAVAYCFTSVEGFSKIGTYTGNGSADGPFVYTGFRPAWILVKSSTNGTASWALFDDERSLENPADDVLFANLSNAEAANNTVTLTDLNSNGFKLRGANTNINSNAATYIYMAFAENPFKNSLAR